MSNLTEFLLARIAEDEAVARAATVAPWIPVDGTVQSPGVPVGMQGPWEHTSPVTRFTLDRDAAHIARFDPAWVLAECEAKRRIVNLHRPEVFEDAPAEAFCTHDQRTSGLWPCPTMRLLALPYADHPSYDPAWEA